MGIIAKASVDKLIRKAGADRVSEDAAVDLAKILEQEGVALAREAVALAEHAGRKTVKKDDVVLATKR
jgi:histone H3/H4